MKPRTFRCSRCGATVTAKVRHDLPHPTCTCGRRLTPWVMGEVSDDE